MRFFVRTGDEWPGGSGVFQITFLLGPNSSGSPVDAETPVPFGPRNCDQSSAPALVNGSNVIKAAINGALDKTKIVFLTFDMSRANPQITQTGRRGGSGRRQAAGAPTHYLFHLHSAPTRRSAAPASCSCLLLLP